MKGPNITELFKGFALRRIPSARLASGQSVINCRCMECGDSSNMSSRHMYLFPPTDKSPATYYCHLCGATGLIDHKRLIAWCIYEDEIAEMVAVHNTEFMNRPRYQKFNPNTRYILANDYITMDDTTRIKMAYINNRLGVNLQPQDFLDLKIVLNLKDLLQRNKSQINGITRDQNVLNDLDRAFVGFLSVDNAFVCLRRVDMNEMVYKGIDQRYVDYRIFNKEDTSQKFYTVPTTIDLLSPGRIPLHIAEGAFDILSIYLNMRHRANGIYSSVTGSNYLAVILHFIMVTKIPNLEVHIYPDNDKRGADWKMERIRNILKPLMIPIYIHRNIAPNEKDFGVSPDRINESIIPFNEIAQTEHFYNINRRV